MIRPPRYASPGDPRVADALAQLLPHFGSTLRRADDPRVQGHAGATREGAPRRGKDTHAHTGARPRPQVQTEAPSTAGEVLARVPRENGREMRVSRVETGNAPYLHVGIYDATERPVQGVALRPSEAAALFEVLARELGHR